MRAPHYKWLTAALVVVSGTLAARVASADPILLSVTGPKVGIFLIGDVSTPTGVRNQRLATSFTTLFPLTNVSIDVGLGTVGTTIEAFLTDAIGPGTTIADQIATSSYSGPPGSNIPLFAGLSLGTGSYFLVLGASGPGTASWNRLLPFTVGAVPGLSRGNDYFTRNLAGYAPSAAFTVIPNTATDGALQYEVLGTVAPTAPVPVPASLILIATGAGIFLRRRRRSQ